MMTCKQLSSLLLSGDLKAAGKWRRLQVRMHLAMCGYCTRFARQLKQLSSAASKLREGTEPSSGFQERIVRRLSR
jgi:hypothetical protein